MNKYIYIRTLMSTSDVTLPIYPVTVFKNIDDLNVFIAINPKTNLYCIFDEQTGLSCGKSFKRLCDAVAFVNDRLEEPFIDWVHRLNDARSSNNYHYLCLLLKRLIEDYEKENKTKKEPVRVL